MSEERLYTLEEANATIEDLRERLSRIRAARDVVVSSAEVVRDRSATNGGGREGSALYDALRTLRQELERLGSEGIILRDADSGLIDFPSRREGRVVYLCWRPDEDRVRYWHEVDSGFPGRKPL